MTLFRQDSRQTLIFGLLASVLLLFSAACSREKSDAQIIGEVATRIQRDSQVPNKNIAISSNKGVVTLNGTANNEAERLAASNDASQIEGVRTVLNNLTIAAPAPQAPAAALIPPPVETPAEAKLIEPPAPAKKPSASHTKTRSTAKDTVKSTTTASDQGSSSASNPMSNTGIINTTPMPASTPSSTSTTASNTAPTKSDAVLIPPPPLPVKMVTIDNGTSISVRLADTIDSNKNKPGDTFRATIDSPVYSGDEIAIPSGATVVGRVVEVKDSGRFTGTPQLALELTTLSINNRQYPIRTNQFTKQGGSQGSRTAKTVGGGAAIGALIGAIAGGGKGAAIGAAVGGAGGGGVQAARGPQSLHLGPEARLNFRLDAPLSVAPTANVDRGNTNPINDTAYNAPPSSNDTYNEPAPVDQSQGDRPVLKRRPAPNSNDSSNPPQ